MNFEGAERFSARRETVWDFLLDVSRVSACVPGLEEVRQLDADHFEGTIVATVGPMSGRFSFRAGIVDRRPPAELLAILDGTDSVTRSTVHGDIVIHLDATSELETELAYRAAVDVHGRLAILGEMVLRATGNLLLQETVRRLREQVEAVETA